MCLLCEQYPEGLAIPGTTGFIKDTDDIQFYTLTMGEFAMPINADSVKDQEVVLWDNGVTRLSRFWEKGPLVLVFLRHYG